MNMILSDLPYAFADVGLFVTMIRSIDFMTLTSISVLHLFVLSFCNLRIIGGVRKRAIWVLKLIFTGMDRSSMGKQYLQST